MPEYLLSVAACEQGGGTNRDAFRSFCTIAAGAACCMFTSHVAGVWHKKMILKAVVPILQTLDAASPTDKPPLLGLILRTANNLDASLCARAAAAACELACSCRDPVCVLVLSDTLRTAVLQHSKVRPPRHISPPLFNLGTELLCTV